MSAIQQMLFAAGASGPTDPNFSSVVLLCHFDGSNAQTTTVDSSPIARTMTSQASAALFTAQSKFGASSMGTGGASSTTPTAGFQAADSADWAFGSGQFTIEAWVYFSAAPGGSVLSVMQQWGNSGSLGWFFGMVAGSLAFYYSTTGSDNPNVGAALTPTLNTWHHIAVDRDASNVLRVYLNGTVHASATVSATLFNAPTVMNVGGYSATFAGINGYIDEARITNGVARYGGAFTPPTAAFPNS